MEDFSVAEADSADQPGTRELTIRGSMTIQHGPEIKAALLRALDASGTVLLDLAEVTEIDLIGLQFVCSTHRAVMASGKHFMLKKTANPVIEVAMREAGFARHMGCVQGAEHTCSWVRGEG